MSRDDDEPKQRRLRWPLTTEIRVGKPHDPGPVRYGPNPGNRLGNPRGNQLAAYRYGAANRDANVHLNLLSRWLVRQVSPRRTFLPPLQPPTASLTGETSLTASLTCPCAPMTFQQISEAFGPSPKSVHRKRPVAASSAWPAATGIRLRADLARDARTPGRLAQGGGGVGALGGDA
jgi:hypothetical protein